MVPCVMRALVIVAMETRARVLGFLWVLDVVFTQKFDTIRKEKKEKLLLFFGMWT